MLEIKKRSPSDCVIALAGNPNVGKSTLFNTLTGMKQHTGNWPGKTVETAQGYCTTKNRSYVLVDLPGTYSIMAHSAEEECARNFICFGEPDAVVVVCDATCLERNLNLVLQIAEISQNVTVCVNLIDEAERKGIKIDLNRLSQLIGAPVISAVARNKKTLSPLLDALDSSASRKPLEIEYPTSVERAIAELMPVAQELSRGRLPARRLSIALLCGDSLNREISAFLGRELDEAQSVAAAIRGELGLSAAELEDIVATAIVERAASIYRESVIIKKSGYSSLDRRLDKVFTGRLTGYPIMLAFAALIFWITISGANYPSELLSSLLFGVQERLSEIFLSAGVPVLIHDALVLGVYRVLAWVVSVMLPPMAIFFPLFTLLEDAGYLPRIAYNLDAPFKRAHACGKQALTMCMGFGCNAVGVCGCRIIDSPRERLCAILTNCFVPCNGRFPLLICISSMFFFGGVLSALTLTLIVVAGIIATLLTTRLLSKTLLAGEASSFTLELPPYRRPQIGKVILRSVIDRTLVVLARAVKVAAPAGLVIWLMANLNVGGATLLFHVSDFLDPLGRLMGLDGVILLAFILSLPANEIVIPIIIMTYLSQGALATLDAESLRTLFVSNGWTTLTAMCTMLFSLMHWPCGTTLLTIKKETGSAKWTFVAFALPTVVGFIVCVVVAFLYRLVV